MLKKLFKNRIFLCVFTALIVGTTSVYAVTYFPSNQVTYENSSSGLKSSDVQGAIDELYSTCSSSIVAGNYLYYTENSLGNGYSTLYRVTLDGNDNNLTRIYQSPVGSTLDSVYVTNDYIYFSENASGGRSSTLYRVTLDDNSNNLETVYKGSAGTRFDSIYVTNDYIYFSENSTGRQGVLYRVTLDGNDNNLEVVRKAPISYSIDSIFIK